MTERRIQIHTLLQAFENETVLGEALHFPEVSRVADTPERAYRALAANARGLAEREALLHLHMRVAPSQPRVQSCKVTLDPPAGLPLWRKPLELTFQAALWEVPGEGWSAYFPALGLEVFTDKEEELARRMTDELMLALRRGRFVNSLWSLAGLTRGADITVKSGVVTADIPSPKDHAIIESREPKEASVLEQVAQNLSAAELPEAYEYGELARRLAEALSEPRPESVLLVGPSGVGKTALFHELVRRRAVRDPRLGRLSFARTPFWATSGSRLVAGMSGFGMWQERCDKLRREASSTRAILHLGGLVELMEVGKGEMIQQGIAGFLRPYIARGDLLCVVECTPEQLPTIERQDPHLLGVFRRIDVPEPEPETAAAILMSAAHELSERASREPRGAPRASKSAGQELISTEVLETLDRLHRRYATYSAYPGRPLRFLRNLLTGPEQPAAVTDAEVYEAFSRETGLPRMMLDASIPMNPGAVREFFASRIIGQAGAIELVTDLLATVKSGLARPRKPLASLLFAGPTGVGKTETAKALAEFLFNDRRRITRFDMSEYGSPAGVQRLVSGAFGDEGQLTSRVREQPFSVLLFDEFEKAHPRFFDLLLQVLGEARLTDGAGRLADFSNTVIIMTSNLGAEGFMQGGIGFGARSVDPAGHFTAALQEFVRPELLNRIDRVVPFMPLDEESVLAIVGRELEMLNLRPGLMSSKGGAGLEVTDAARRLIAGRAYQPALGARPLKREIERGLLVPLAEALNTQPTAYALYARADAVDGELTLDVAPLTDDSGRAGAEAWLSKLIDDCLTLRRKLQTAMGSEAILRLRNEMYRLGRTVERAATARKRSVPEGRAAGRAPSYRVAEAEHRLGSLRRVLKAFESVMKATCDVEDRLALAALGGPGRSRPMEEAARGEVDDCLRGWDEALRALMALDAGGATPEGADRATLYVYSHHNEMMFDLARGYFDWAGEHARSRSVFWATRELSQVDIRELQRRAEFDPACVAALSRMQADDGEKEGEPRPLLYPPVDAEHFLANPREDTGAIVMRLEGEDIGLKLQREQGCHRFRPPSDTEAIDVDVKVFSEDVWHAGLPVPRGLAGDFLLRRRYNLAQRQAKDALLDQIFAWTGGRLAGVLDRAIEATFQRELERQVGL